MSGSGGTTGGAPGSSDRLRPNEPGSPSCAARVSGSSSEARRLATSTGSAAGGRFESNQPSVDIGSPLSVVPVPVEVAASQDGTPLPLVSPDPAAAPARP